MPDSVNELENCRSYCHNLKFLNFDNEPLLQQVATEVTVKPPILGPVLKLVFNVQFEDMVNAVA